MSGDVASAGWYPADGGERYWDGAVWTDQVRPIRESASERARAGWYVVDEGERWWDGTGWTDQIRPRSRRALAKHEKQAAKEAESAAKEAAQAEKQAAKEAGSAAKEAAQAEKHAAKEAKSAAKEAARDEKKLARKERAAAIEASDVRWQATVLRNYGPLVKKASMGMTEVEIYEKGYVRVAWGITAATPFERLLGIKYQQTVQDKSPGGRMVGAFLTMGLNSLMSNERVTSTLVIATDRKVRTLGMTDGHISGTGLALEVAGQSVLEPIQREDSVPDGTPHSESTNLEELARLADLREKGAVTDEEFEALKARILAR